MAPAGLSHLAVLATKQAFLFCKGSPQLLMLLGVCARFAQEALGLLCLSSLEALPELALRSKHPPPSTSCLPKLPCPHDFADLGNAEELDAPHQGWLDCQANQIATLQRIAAIYDLLKGGAPLPQLAASVGLQHTEPWSDLEVLGAGAVHNTTPAAGAQETGRRHQFSSPQATLTGASLRISRLHEQLPAARLYWLQSPGHMIVHQPEAHF